MAYSVDYRTKVLEYLEKGHTHAEAEKEFKIGRTTIQKWKKLRSETGGLENRNLSRKPRVYKSEKLRAYIEVHPRATLREIAEHFEGSISGVYSALERENLILKP